MRENSAALTARALVATLIARGVGAVAYCPGSRNAPFAYALAGTEERGLLRVATFSDERAAGFWAVGFMKARGGKTPVAVITTSGTAVAELHAPLEEARHQELPLVVISADRPHHMRGVGASQTTRQEGIFAHSVAASNAIPATTRGEISSVQAVLDRLLTAARETPGPVHLNVAFTEPLVPATAWQLPEVHLPVIKSAKEQHPSWDEVVEPGLRTLVIAGDQADQAVIAEASRRAVPIVAEPSSGATVSPVWVPHGPLVLSNLPAAAKIQQVVVTGHPTLSRPVSGLLNRPELRQVVVSPRAVYPSVSGLAAVVTRGLEEGSAPPEQEISEWTRTWLEAGSALSALINNAVGADLNLLSAARSIWTSDPAVALWLAASNAVRGFDVGASAPGRAGVYANRGLAGIDGSLAGPLGIAAGLGEPVRAVIGDLAFAADLPSLVQRPDLPGTAPDIQAIVFNDGGGSIFASLEHGSAPAEIYDRYFGVAPHMDISALARGAGWQASVARTLPELEEILAAPIEGRSLVDVRFPSPAGLLRKVGAGAKALLSG